MRRLPQAVMYRQIAIIRAELLHALRRRAREVRNAQILGRARSTQLKSSRLTFRSSVKCFASSSATLRKSAKKLIGSRRPSLPSTLPTRQFQNRQTTSIARSIAHCSMAARECIIRTRVCTEEQQISAAHNATAKPRVHRSRPFLSAEPCPARLQRRWMALVAHLEEVGRRKCRWS